MKPRVIAIVQGRMESTRLPGKIMMDIAGKPMLERVFTRTSRSKSIHQTWIATTTNLSDNTVADFCIGNSIHVYRGNEFDVLDRFYQLVRDKHIQVIVRITADCPLIDPDLIDKTVNILIQENLDFLCNRLPPPYHRTYPIGLDIEACTLSALEDSWNHAQKPYQREHVMPYIYEGVELTRLNPTLETGYSSHGYKIGLLHNNPDYGHYRWTVDTAEDLDFIRKVFEHFNGRDDFSWGEVLELVHAMPNLMEINAAIPHKNLHDTDPRSTRIGG
jgi:spore coat polysaccharide biosynthesis protein SpsF